ncbi:MAG: Trk system potassium transporter TrkA [Spirochaetes bacterium]|nr:MAG: Trk system potassium transporter TrkA [Spirochaetota bacterium]
MMKAVIAGAGTVGQQIARQLIEENRDVVVIEQDTRVARRVSNYLDCMVINGEVNNLEILERAGVGNADFFIAVTDSDEVNIISCGIVGEKFEVPCKIARIKNIEYENVYSTHNKFMGIDYLVNPEVEAAKDIIKAIEYGALSEVLRFEKTSFQIRNIIIEHNSPVVNTTIKELRESSGLDFLVAFISRQNELLIPSGYTKIMPEDNLYILASEEVLEELFASLGKFKLELKKIVIAGGGRIGTYVAEHLLEKQKRDMKFFSKRPFRFFKKIKHNIILIDRDIERCKQLSERFQGAIILNEDITDEGIYDMNQLYDYDLLITATGNQELNIISAIFGKTLGIKRAIAVVDKRNYVEMAGKLGVDVTVCKNSSMVNTILKLTRRGNIKNIYSFADGRVELIELMVENPDGAGRRLREINLPSETLVVSLTRNNTNILPDGNSVIKTGDYIVAISKKESIPKLVNIFTKKP